MTENLSRFAASVVIPTHNPREDYLQRVLEALRRQTLAKDLWELVIIDNGSREPLKAAVGPRDYGTTGPQATEVDLSWHSNARIVREEALGLTNARLRGFAETRGEVMVLVDDDNVLALDYLEQAVRIAREYPFLGAWSGQSIAEFEDPSNLPHPLLKGFLQDRRLDADCWSNDRNHTKSDPYGAGMCVRRCVADAYRRKLDSQPERKGLDLQGSVLIYGGDLDLAFAGLDIGLGKGVFQSLSFIHLMPKHRCETGYLLRAAEGHAQSQVLAAWLNGDVLPDSRENWRSSALEWVRCLMHGPIYRARWRAWKQGTARGKELIAKLQTERHKLKQ